MQNRKFPVGAKNKLLRNLFFFSDWKDSQIKTDSKLISGDSGSQTGS